MDTLDLGTRLKLEEKVGQAAEEVREAQLEGVLHGTLESMVLFSCRSLQGELPRLRLGCRAWGVSPKQAVGGALSGERPIPHPWCQGEAVSESGEATVGKLGCKSVLSAAGDINIQGLHDGGGLLSRASLPPYAVTSTAWLIERLATVG